jgi:hypothetical protein
MDFFTHFLKKNKLIAVLLQLMIMCLFTTHASADGIIVQSVKLEQNEATFSLDATFHIDLSPIIQEALHKGVSLHLSLISMLFNNDGIFGTKLSLKHLCLTDWRLVP